MGMPVLGQRAGLAEKAFHLTADPRSMGHFDGGLGVQVQMLPQIAGCPVSLSQQLDQLKVAELPSNVISHLRTSCPRRRAVALCYLHAMVSTTSGISCFVP